MLPPRNTSRPRLLPGRHTTRPIPALGLVCALAAVSLVLGLSPAVALAQPERVGEPGASDLEAPLVAPSHGVRAHGVVERWVRRGEVPASDETDAEPEAGEGEVPAASEAERIEVTNLLGVRVTLRLEGMTIGRGDAYRPDLGAVVGEPGAAVELVGLLRDATAEALREVRGNLHDAHRQAVTSQFANDAPDPPALADVVDRLMVDIQLAHDVEPIEIDSDAELTAVLTAFAPGYHGLYSPSPDDGAGGEAAAERAIVWPATAIARRSTPRGQLMRLLDARGRDPQAILELGRVEGLALLRFDVVHVVRAQPHLPARPLVRGHELLPSRSISSRTLDGMIDRLAEHLQGRFTSRHLVRGTYHPTSHRYDPDVAETRDVGLACYALMRYAQRRAEVAGYDASFVREAAEAARGAAVRLGEALLEEPDAQRPTGLALAMLTLIADIEPGDHGELRDQLAAALLAMYEPGEDDEAGAFYVTNEEGERERIGQGTAAVVTAGLASLYVQTRDERVGEVVREQIEALWTEAEQRPNVASLPWLVLAHHRAGRLLADEGDGQQLAGRQRGFGVLAERLMEHQVTERPVFGPADVVGGFELNPGPLAAPPSPDWRTAHMLSYLALCLREPGITADHDAMGWVLNAALAGRFIAQLMMDETSCYYVRSLPEAVGGVRMATWDNRLPISATAMSLLATVQFQETLERHAEQFGG